MLRIGAGAAGGQAGTDNGIEGRWSHGEQRRGRRLHNALVVGEVAVALVLSSAPVIDQDPYPAARDKPRL